jgi:hypothetical protein
VSLPFYFLVGIVEPPQLLSLLLLLPSLFAYTADVAARSRCCCCRCRCFAKATIAVDGAAVAIFLLVYILVGV